MNLLIITEALGGLGLFLLGMHLMTEGLRLAAGRTLRSILERGTCTKIRGIGSGFMITALVQSSSAVTVATLGFVNAGLINLRQAITVIYGSNIGTTMTAWLVALIGFNVDIKLFALPAIGLGMFLRLFSNNKRYSGFGDALTGFGIFFLGIEVLKGAFGEIGRSIDFIGIEPDGLGLVMLVAGGFAMTLLMQSSSAAMAIIITATGSNIIPLEAAAAMVIGANIGTTSTALLAVIGATANAKRAAAAHVIFNLLTATVALAILSLLLSFVLLLQEQLGQTTQTVTILALFHTVFNVLGVLLIWPWTDRLSRFLQQRFRTHEEDEQRPHYLDQTLTSTPVLAVNALIMELERIAKISRRATKWAISSEYPEPKRPQADRKAIEQLTIATSKFCTEVQKNNLPAELAAALPNSLRVARYHLTITQLAEEIARVQDQITDTIPEKIAPEIAQFKRSVVKLIDFIGDGDQHIQDGDRLQGAAERLETLEKSYQQLKTHILQTGARGETAAKDMVMLLELMSNIRRLAQQTYKSLQYIETFKSYAPAEVFEDAPLSK